jgi:hypothetical protein
VKLRLKTSPQIQLATSIKLKNPQRVNHDYPKVICSQEEHLHVCVLQYRHLSLVFYSNHSAGKKRLRKELKPEMCSSIASSIEVAAAAVAAVD